LLRTIVVIFLIHCLFARYCIFQIVFNHSAASVFNKLSLVPLVNCRQPGLPPILAIPPWCLQHLTPQYCRKDRASSLSNAITTHFSRVTPSGQIPKGELCGTAVGGHVVIAATLALCDILYKRLRNTLTYLLTYLLKILIKLNVQLAS